MNEDYSDSAMIALVPSVEDAARLAVEGYEEPENLHVTLAFLGDVSAIGDDDDAALRAVCQNMASKMSGPLALKAFATAHFNPEDKPCAVYLIGDDSGHLLEDLAEQTQTATQAVFAALPQQHRPYVPHLTAGYDLDPNALTQVGPITFDRIRYAKGTSVEDFPLTDTASLAASVGADLLPQLERLEAIVAARSAHAVSNFAHDLKAGWEEALHPRGKDGQFIRKNGTVRGEFTAADGSRLKSASAKVIGFKSGNGASVDDPWVLTEVTKKDGTKIRGVARASTISDKAAAKARLDVSAPSTDTKPDVTDLRARVHKGFGYGMPDGSPDYAKPTRKPTMIDMDKAGPIPERKPGEGDRYSALRERVHGPDAGGDIKGTTLTPDFIATVQAQEGEAIKVNSVEEAVKHLAEGHKIELHQPEQVSTLLDKLAENVREARSLGAEAPVYDLCKVTAKGTSLFCVESKGISRVVMPQLSGPPKPGSRAANLPVNRHGNVDLSDQFRQHLAEKGIAIVPTQVEASRLRASQNELNGGLVASLTDAMENGTFTKDTPLFVSRDNYVVDGHHRWAATVGLSYRQGEPLDMDVEKIDMDIIELLAEANNFTRDWGITKAAVSDEKISNEDAREILPDIPPGTSVEPQNHKPSDYLPPDPRVHNAAFVAAQNRVEFGQKLGVEAGFDTQTLHDMVDGKVNAYTADRHLLQMQVVRRFMEKTTAKRERKMLFMGGLPGAGKTTFLNSEVGQREIGIDLNDYIEANPDEVKAIMADLGMIPDYQSSLGLTDGESATLLHEESSWIAGMVAEAARKEGLNVVIDISLKNAEQYERKSKPFAEAGYSRQLVFVDVPPHVAMQRAIERYMDPAKEGRYMPLDMIAAQGIPDDPDASLNQRGFDEIAERSQGLVDHYLHVRNVDGPEVVRSGGSRESLGRPVERQETHEEAVRRLLADQQV